MKPVLTMFEGKKIRRIWDNKKEKWYFSVVDIVSVLSGSDGKDIGAYRRKLKQRLKIEGSEVVTKCHGLKLLALDGKYRITDVADTEIIFRIIQSIPSSNAEPFKLRLARVGYERIEETEDPELGINRALQNYINKGYDENWINQRLKSIEVRKSLTDEWQQRGILDKDYAILTDEITKARAGLSTRQYKDYKGLKSQSLRDNMSNLELILNMLAEASTTEISLKEEPETFDHSKEIAHRGGKVAGLAKEKLEKETGKKIISPKNYLSGNKRLKNK